VTNLSFKPTHCREAGIVKLFGSFVTTTSGTIGSSSTKGFTIAKTGSETGRYTVTLDGSYTKLMQVGVNVIGAEDAAATSAKGVVYFLRNVSVTDSTPTFQIQFCDADGSPADAEVQDAAEVLIEITLKNSSAW
jgi:hypothetical protein